MTNYLVDTSAWHRSSHESIAERWDQLLRDDQIWICDQVRLEILFSARRARDHDALREELGALHHAAIDGDTWARAIDVQGRLAHRGGLHHRSVKIADLVIAAAAEAAELVVLHYDQDFDRIAAVTDQRMEWIARRGSI